jgi:hypothetical protein
MPSSGIRHRVGLVKTDVSEDHVALIFKVEGNSELGATLTVTSRPNYCAVHCGPIRRQNLPLHSTGTSFPSLRSMTQLARMNELSLKEK